jgi:hypothetical protein
MELGEFPEPLLRSAKKVAIVLTQSWCPQWQRMKPFLGELADSQALAVYYVEYDTEPFFREFLEFKERAFGNDQVPYLRYYSEGRFLSSGNYSDRLGFMSRLGLAGDPPGA